MDYKAPYYNELGAIGAVMNPLTSQPQVKLVSDAIAYGPTRVMADPSAGFVEVAHTGLDGRHFDRDYFAPGNWELSGRHGGSDFFAPGQWELSGWRDALDVFTAASFLFPE